MKLQVKKDGTLLCLLAASINLAKEYGMEWSLGKCSVLKKGGQRKVRTMKMSRRPIKNYIEADYHGFIATADGTEQKANIK